MIITTAILRQEGACPEQIALFGDTFDFANVPWTPENLAKALRVELDIRWIAYALRLPLDLHGADLSGAVLFDVDLSGADLSGANLSNAILYGADLSDADLTGADLTGVDLRGTRLTGAKLTDVILSGAILPVGWGHDKMPGQEV